MAESARLSLPARQTAAASNAAASLSCFFFLACLVWPSLASLPSCTPELSLTIHCEHPALTSESTTGKIRVQVWSGDYAARTLAGGTDWIDDLCPQAHPLRSVLPDTLRFHVAWRCSGHHGQPSLWSLACCTMMTCYLVSVLLFTAISKTRFLRLKTASRNKVQMLYFPAEDRALYYWIDETADLIVPHALLHSFQTPQGVPTSFTIDTDAGNIYFIDYITWTLQDCVDPDAPARTGSLESAQGKGWCLSTNTNAGTGSPWAQYSLNGPGCKPSQDFLLPSPTTPSPSCSPELNLTINCEHPALTYERTSDPIRVRVWSGDYSTRAERALAGGTDWIAAVCPQAQTLRSVLPALVLKLHMAWLFPGHRGQPSLWSLTCTRTVMTLFSLRTFTSTTSKTTRVMLRMMNPETKPRCCTSLTC